MSHSGSWIIDGNPFHEQALEVARTAAVGFTLNVAMDDRREVTGIFAGDLETAHVAGVCFVEERAIAFVVVAVPIVAEGGTIILAARCAEGLGSPKFRQLPAEIDARLADATGGGMGVRQRHFRCRLRLARGAGRQLGESGDDAGAPPGKGRHDAGSVADGAGSR